MARQDLLERPPGRIVGGKARLQQLRQALIALLEPGQHARQVLDARTAELPERVTACGRCGLVLHGVGAGRGDRAEVRALERELMANELDLVHDRSTNGTR